MGDRTVKRGGKSPRSPYVTAALVAAALAAAVAVAHGLSRPAPKPRPDVPETETAEPPPDFPLPRTEDERIQRLIEMLFSGDTDDATWTRTVLARAGEPARAAVSDAAKRCFVSNRAFVEHAFDLLLRDPRPSDVPLAFEALSNPDPEVVKRGCVVLARVGGPSVRAEMDRVAAVASMAWPLPVYALDVLTALGGDDAVAHLGRIATSPEIDEGVREQALLRLGKVGGEAARAILRREFDLAKDDDRLIAAAEGLVTMGDPAPLARLRTMFQLAKDERALTLLSRAADDVALREIETRLRAPLETEQRRVHAMALLASYPVETKAPLLRFSAGTQNPREVRVEARTALWKCGDPADRDEVLRLLRAAGPEGREDRIVAALVLGQVRDPSTAPALLLAEAAARADAEVRAMLLRALVLTGSPDGAETIVRAIASDPSDHLAPQSLAYEISVMFPEAPKPFRDAAGPWILKALGGELGTPGPAARVHLIAAAVQCCGDEAGPLVQPYLTDDSRHLREAAAEALVWVGGPSSLPALRTAWWRRQDRFSREAIRRALERVVLVRPVR